MADQPAGALLDALGVTIDLDEGQQLTEALVIGKVIDLNDESGRAILIIAKSDGMDWIAQRGLLSAATHVLNETTVEGDE